MQDSMCKIFFVVVVVASEMQLGQCGGLPLAGHQVPMTKVTLSLTLSTGQGRKKYYERLVGLLGFCRVEPLTYPHSSLLWQQLNAR